MSSARVEKTLIVIAILAVAMVLLGTLAMAQTVHPCDVQQITTEVRPGVPFAVGVCHTGQDVEGLATTVDSFRVTIDGATVFTGTMTKSATANAQGKFYYESPKTLTAAKGTHTVVVYAISAEGGESGPSDPLVITSKPGNPKKVENLRVIR